MRRALERRKEINQEEAKFEEIVSKLDAEQTKFLGGDLEHTHFVKGLDFALLQKMWYVHYKYILLLFTYMYVYCMHECDEFLVYTKVVAYLLRIAIPRLQVYIRYVIYAPYILFIYISI